MRHGEQVFADTCTKCHRARTADTQPVSLALSPVVNAATAENLMRVLRDGIVPPRTVRHRAMPAQSQKLTEQDLADVAADVRWRFADQPAWGDIPLPARVTAPVTGTSNTGG